MDEAEPIPKKRKEDVDLNKKDTSKEKDTVLSNLLEWMEKEHFTISPKIKISQDGACARYGVFALDDILEDEVLFVIPRASLLWENNCSISSELSAAKFPTGGSGWVKLILCLMFEYTNDSSRWKPYMSFVPPASCMDQPMFWSSKEIEVLLKGTGLRKAVSKDTSSIEKEYLDIALPFIKQHSSLGFKEDIHTLELYKHMVAFVMAYSFTEPCDDDEAHPPVMAPFADVLNHVSRNNARLEFEPRHLSMVAIKAISKGEEIYNTYGPLSNSQLLQMYGFVEPASSNIYDTIDIELSSFVTAAKSNETCWQVIDEKMQWFDEKRGMDENCAITVGKDGILNVHEFKLLLKVLSMSEEQFKWHSKNSDDWDTDSSVSSEEADTESEFDVFSFRKLKQNLSRNQKTLLQEASSIRLQKAGVLKDHEIHELKSSSNSVDLDRLQQSRITRSKSLVEGQLQLLRLLLETVAT